MFQVDSREYSKVEIVSEAAIEEMLLESLERRELPDCFLYVGNGGAERWLALAASGEFPLAARLTDLLESSAPRIAGHFTGPLDLMSIGVGGGEKERILARELAPGRDLKYFAVDISARMVEKALEAVADVDVPKVRVVARFEDLPELQYCWDSPVLLCLLGNTFCNFEPDFVLGMVRARLRPGDAFLFDCNLLPVGGANGAASACFAEQVEKVYRSELNRRFNIAPLVERGIDPDACMFHLDLVRVRTQVGDAYRTSKRLELLEDSTVTAGGKKVALTAGETIQMGFTYKYEPGQVRSLVKRHGFEEVDLFCSPDGENMLTLLH